MDNFDDVDMPMPRTLAGYMLAYSKMLMIENFQRIGAQALYIDYIDTDSIVFHGGSVGSDDSVVSG